MRVEECDIVIGALCKNITKRPCVMNPYFNNDPNMSCYLLVQFCANVCVCQGNVSEHG